MISRLQGCVMAICFGDVDLCNRPMYLHILCIYSIMHLCIMYVQLFYIDVIHTISVMLTNTTIILITKMFINIVVCFVTNITSCCNSRHSITYSHKLCQSYGEFKQTSPSYDTVKHNIVLLVLII